MSSCLYHESLPITCVNVYTMRNKINRNTKILLQENRKTNYTNTILRNTQIQITGIKKEEKNRHKKSKKILIKKIQVIEIQES